jgi:hypothetical protein
LVRAALVLAKVRGPAVLALDSVRCGRWEIFTVGLVWHRRVLLVGWSVLPYPWPKGRFTPTVCQLLRTVADAWPADQPPPHLVADRGFPSKAFFATLAALGWGFTVRLRSRDVLVVAGTACTMRCLWTTAGDGCWRHQPAHYGQRPGTVAGWVVVGRGLAVLAWHQRDAGSARVRQEQGRLRRHHLVSKHPHQGPTTAVQSDTWIALFTSQPRWRRALGTYRQRWSIEGTYRDLQSGWDGRVGWDLERVVSQEQDAGQVEARVGLAALGLVCQLWLGDQAGQDAAPEAVHRLARQWTTTNRLSPWARGHLLFVDRAGAAEAWLQTMLQAAADLLVAAPPLVHPAVGACRTLRSAPQRKAA